MPPKLRGRPKKATSSGTANADANVGTAEQPARRLHGRPRKNPLSDNPSPRLEIRAVSTSSSMVAEASSEPISPPKRHGRPRKPQSVLSPSPEFKPDYDGSESEYSTESSDDGGDTEKKDASEDYIENNDTSPDSMDIDDDDADAHVEENDKTQDGILDDSNAAAISDDDLSPSPAPLRRRPGRPRKPTSTTTPTTAKPSPAAKSLISTPRKRGRPKKITTTTEPAATIKIPTGRPRGRPRKDDASAPALTPAAPEPKTFTLDAAYGSYIIDAPELTAAFPAAKNLTMDISAAPECEDGSMLAAEYDFDIVEGTMRLVQTKEALVDFVDQQEAEEKRSGGGDVPVASADYQRGEAPAAVGVDKKHRAGTGGALGAGPSKKVRGPEGLKVPRLYAVIRGRDTASGEIFADPNVHVGFLDFDCLGKAFRGKIDLPMMQVVKVTGRKVGGSAGNPHKWNDLSLFRYKQERGEKADKNEGKEGE